MEGHLKSLSEGHTDTKLRAARSNSFDYNVGFQKRKTPRRKTREEVRKNIGAGTPCRY